MNVTDVVRRIAAGATENPLLERLLVASLELVVVTLLVLAIIHIARVRSSRVVAIMWLVAMAKPLLVLAVGAPAPVFNIGSLGVIPPAVVTEADETATARATSGYTINNATPAVAAAVTTTTASAPVVGASSDPSRAAFGVWLVGAGLMALLSIADRLRVKRLVSAATRPSPAIEALYAEAAGQRTDRLPRLLVSDRIESPAIAGTFLPVVFLPAWMTRRPDRERIVWALRHELTHWRHRDPLAGLLGEIARIVFFFHPLVWWIGRKWKVATEIACDQALVGTRRDARHYAEQLYQILARVHTRRRIMLANSLFATRTQIGKRIEILLKSRPAAGKGRKFPAVVFLLVFAALVFSMGTEIAPVAKEKRITIKTDDSKSASSVITVDEDGRTLTIATEGDVVFNKARTDIVIISGDGSFKITEDRDGVERELEVTPKDDGELEWVYKVDGKKKPFDDDAREWFRECVKHVDIHDDDSFVIVTRPPHVQVRPRIVVEDMPHIEVRVVEPDQVVDIRDVVVEFDKAREVIELTLDDVDEGKRVWISAEGDTWSTAGEKVKLSISKNGKIHITLKKDGDRHELEITPGDDEPVYIYKLNGEVKPYSIEAKKIFEKYLEHLEDGFELHVGEKI
jgi:beta-lactamase regulating signal transducer with metallopeptidase domain